MKLRIQTRNDHGRELSSGTRRLGYVRPERLLVHSHFLKIFGKYSGENIHVALHGHKVTNFPWLSVIYEGSVHQSAGLRCARRHEDS